MNPPAGAVINEDNKTICLYGVLYWYWNEKTMRVIGSMNKEVHITGYLAPVYQRDTIPKLTLCN